MKMRKFLLSTFAVATVFVLSSCGRENQDIEESVNYIVGDYQSEAMMLVPTAQARDIALYDFDYLVDRIMQTVPIKNIFYRRFDVSMEDFFATWRQVIYDKTPIKSLTEELIGERWADVPEDDQYLAAEYLMAILHLMATEVEMIGHFAPLSVPAFYPFSIMSLELMKMGQILTQEMIDLWIEHLGYDVAKIQIRAIEAISDFGRSHYEIFSIPQTTWFYGATPWDFVSEADAVTDPIFNNPNNVTTEIIEQGRIAYLRIGNFMNNMALDAAVLFPFYEEIQNYEHLIIDLRGNGGGDARSFAANVLTMLIDKDITFQRLEFFVANDLTSRYFKNPAALSEFSVWSDILSIDEFMQNHNMPNFNPEDLKLLDYAIIWDVFYTPAVNNTPFGGEIWLLIDGGSASAAELAAISSIYSGFATVVGERQRQGLRQLCIHLCHCPILAYYLERI